MKANRPSRTAEHNALFRAIEYSRPPQARIVSDPFAFSFLGTSFRLTALLSHVPGLRALLCRYIDYRWPGSRTSLVARTRLIDEYLARALGSGVRQIVLLGAGFDSRAYRLPGADRVQFFEIDHPNTSAKKMALVGRLFGTPPSHVRYVPVDFQTETLQQVLADAGFEARDRSLFLWEGVSNYLTEEAVRTTLSFIASLTEGTQLVFTYVDQSVICNPSGFAGGREVQRAIAKLEEPWTFGIRPERATEFLRECGLSLDSDLSAADYRRLYYGPNDRIRGYEFYHVVTAHVSPPQQRGSEQRQEVHHA
ncbi:MAG: SAM-dependent methyltransferase [Acidobacteriaceae bacterium]